MRWLTLLLALFLLAGCDGGDDRSSNQDWDLSGTWELDSDIGCTSAFLSDIQLGRVEASFAHDFGTFIVEQRGDTGRIHRLNTDFERTATLSNDMFSYSYEGTVLDGPGDFDVFGTVLSDNLVEIREDILVTNTNEVLICHYFMRKV